MKKYRGSTDRFNSRMQLEQAYRTDSEETSVSTERLVHETEQEKMLGAQCEQLLKKYKHVVEKFFSFHFDDEIVLNGVIKEAYALEGALERTMSMYKMTDERFAKVMARAYYRLINSPTVEHADQAQNPSVDYLEVKGYAIINQFKILAAQLKTKSLFSTINADRFKL